MDLITIIGSVAATASVASFAPQAWRIIHTRQTEGLSVRMYALTVLAFAMWLAFGILKQEWPIIVPNFLCLLLALFILVMLILPRRTRVRVADSMDPGAD